MTRFRPFPRDEYNRLLRAWAQRNVKLLGALILGMVALVGFETAIAVFLMPDGGFRWWFLGVLQTVAVAMGLHLINAAFLTHEREAILQLRGAWGEDATRDELKRAKRKKLIRGWVDSVGLQAGDLDHLVVTRNGGLIAVDSKWRSEGNDVAAMARSAAKARLRAEGVARSLLKAERGSHRAKGHAVTVRPLVVIWGPAQHTLRDDGEVAGIPFVGGRRLLAWLKDADGEQVSKATAKETIRELKRFRARTRAAEIARKG
ncbi:MAG: hypothetical protein ACTHNS_06145 [Marmoricola sp.]